MTRIKNLPAAQRILDNIETADVQAQQQLEAVAKSLSAIDGDRVLDKLKLKS